MTAPVIEPGQGRPGTFLQGEEGQLGGLSSPPASNVTIRCGRTRVSLRCTVCAVRESYEGPHARQVEFASMFTAAHVFCEGPWWEEDGNE